MKTNFHQKLFEEDQKKSVCLTLVNCLTLRSERGDAGDGGRRGNASYWLLCYISVLLQV